MEAAIIAGASIVNDITALSGDPRSIGLLKNLAFGYSYAHARSPVDMQNKPYYEFAPLDIFEYLRHRIMICLEAGISKSNLMLIQG